MKKFLKFLIIFLVVVIVLPIALLFIFFFDTSKMSVTYDDAFTTEKWSSALVVDSLDNTTTEKRAKFQVTEEDINNFINASIKDNAELKKYMTQLAVDIKDDSYVLNVSGKFLFFETRARFTCTLSKEKVNDKDAYVLKVDKMALGRLSQLKNIVMFFVNQFVVDETIDEATAELHLHSDLANSRLYMYTTDLRDMLNKGMSGGNGTSNFYFAFINDFLDKNLVTVDFYGNESLNVSVNLEPLTGNDFDSSVGSYVAYPMKYEDTKTQLNVNGQTKKLSLDTIREALVYLLDRRDIAVDDLTPISDFLFQGYKGTLPNKSEKLSAIGIANPETYQGFNLASDFSLDDTIKNSVADFSHYNLSGTVFDLVSLRESDINDFLKSQSVFGNKYLLHREVGSEKNKVNYIALDNAYINFFNETAIISVGLNINGLETMITLKMAEDKSNTNTHKLVYNPAKVYFGEEKAKLELSDDSKKVVFDTLAEAVNQDSFKFDNGGNLTISFDAIIDQAINSINSGSPAYDEAYKKFLKEESDMFIMVEGKKITDNSEIVIQAIRR